VSRIDAYRPAVAVHDFGGDRKAETRSALIA